MKIRFKVLVTALVSLAMALSLTVFIVKGLLVGYIEKEEISRLRESYIEAQSILQREEDTFQNTQIDWAQWDDAYQFMKDRNSAFVETNLQPETLNALKLDYMVFLDLDYNIINANFREKNIVKLSDVMKELVSNVKAKDFFRKGDSVDPVTGETIIFNTPMLISISPITTTDGTAAPDGYLLTARHIGNEFIQYMENVLHVKILKTKALGGGYEETTLDLSGNGAGLKKILVKKNSKTLSSYSERPDILHSETIPFGIVIERELYRNGLVAIGYFGWIYSIALLIVAGLCIYVFDRIVTHRIKKLYAFIDNVRISGDTSTRFVLTGRDEISRLSTSMNNMLERIDGSYNELREQDERFKRVMEATNDGFFDADLKNNMVYISPSWLNYLGITDKDPLTTYQRMLDFIMPEDRTVFENALNRYLAKDTDHFRVECRTARNNGGWFWIVIRGRVTSFDEFGRPTHLVGTISDITKRKKYEEENLYLLQTDPITTLKNRAYMESMLKKADQCLECDGWIIMGDVNGLKLVNDSFGHQEGDKLLRTIGEILKECCSESDTPSRWGGDEFLILVMNRDAAYVERLIRSIKSECDRTIHYPFKISIAMGSARKDEAHGTSDSVLKLAEERMYRNKLLESRSTRSGIISSLEQSLHEKHIETQEHTKRIKNMCILIGHSLGMSREELDELALLGVLHDIGKIGIPEAVLMKPDKLTDEEWEIMKTHTEIGYRIAASTPELAHIADEILSHHERYDGRGYPQGLSGGDIPKLSRLLAIVDSFDVMTHDRVYKKAMDVESAVEELKQCSGRQFDPEMVKAFLQLLEENGFDQKKWDSANEGNESDEATESKASIA